MKKSFLFFFGIVLSFFTYAQVQVSQPKETEYGDPRHRATIRMESATLCPGQEVELGIYVDLLLGQSGGGSGSYTPEQLPPDPLDNFMFYFYISDTSAAEVVCSSTEHRSPTYRVGYPVLSDKMSELAGGSLTCGYIEGSDDGLGKRGRFTCIWVRSRPSVQLIPTIERPLFKIRVRLKKAVPVTISIDDPNEIAFSTGLAQMGGYYYSFYNVPGGIPNRVPGTLTVDKGPDKATVSAGSDSVICIGERVFFNAEGGKSYRWSQCYNPGIEGGYNYEHLSNVNTKNPTFYPLHSGPYIYQVEAFDERGCSTRDTVVYTVQQNYLKNLVVDPANTLVDSGSRVRFSLKGSANAGAMGRLKVIMEPDSLFPQGGNMVWAKEEAGYNKGLTVEGSLLTKPVYEPMLLVATLQDTACSIQTSASICINGVGVTGKIAPFPVYRCGEDRTRKTLQLNLLTHGGSNNFLYNWRAVDLEFTQFPGAAPKIDNPNLRSPNITYYGRFAVSVDIYDMITGETVTISDTVIKRDWITAETKVVLDTLSLMAEGLNVGGPYCDGTVLTYKAQSVNAGKDARYLWQVNGVWKEEGINDTVFSADLYKGDSVQCILYSTEACVRNMAAESEPFSPDIRRPVNPTIEIVNRDPDGFGSCGIELQAVCHEVGRLFRLQWLRNGEVEVDTLVRAQNPDYDTVNVSLERRGFYDGFTCMLTETDMPCGGMDTVFATVPTEDMPPGQSTDFSGIQTVYPLSASDALPKIGPVQMESSLVCGTDPFTLTAQVQNLTERFELRWYRKAADDSVLLGFYRYPYTTANLDYSLLGEYAGYGYNQGQDNTDILPAFRDGFKIILNDPKADVNERKTFSAGDTVFYVLSAEYDGYFCNPVDPQTLVLRSPYFVPSIMEPAEAPTLVVDYVEKTSLCPGTGHAYHLVASMESRADYRLDWTFMDLSVTDPEIAGYFNLSGQRNDTLESRLVIKPGINAGTWGDCTATITNGCHAGHKQTVAFNLNDHVLNTPGFRIRHSEDTIVCADMPVQHYAQVVELSDVSATSQAEPLSQTSGSYEIYWARSLQNLISGIPEATGNTFSYTPVPNGNTPNGSGDFEDNRGIFATYIKAKETNSGCEVIDSVLVMVAHPYEVKASIDYLLSDTWCDSSDHAATDPTRLVEGFPFRVGGQYALLRIENGGAAPIIEWGLNDEVYRDMPYDTLDMAGAPDGDTLKAWVTTSMYTCLSEKAAAAPKLIRLARRGDLYTHAPESAIAGEEVLLQAYVGEHKHSIAGIDGYNFTYSMQLPDGGWQEIETNLAANRYGWLDTLRAQMPAYTGRFRVEGRDKYNVCPAQMEDIDVTLAVETGITMRLFDPATKREIKGLCPQSYGFVYADGQPAPQDQAVWVNNTREPMDVLVRTYPQNPTGKAFVVYYKNGALSAVGPVGTEPLPFDPKDGFGDCRVLQRGDTITGRILPGESFGAMYVHDTVSIDGNSIHHTAQFHLEAIDTTGSLVVSATPKAVCAGDEVHLSAAFEKGTASVSWLPENGVTVTGGHTATATPQQTSVYTAVGRDANGCWWKDSVKVNMADNSQPISISLKTDSLLFCGEKLQMGVWMDSIETPTEYFEKYYWYEINASGNRLIDSTTEAYLTYWASNGSKLMMQARSTLSCQEGLSQSDTLVFGGFAYPQLHRLSPVAADTTVCPLSEVRIAYRVEPADALMQWYGELDGYSEYIEEATDHFDFVADENARFIVTAKNADMPVCATTDTVRVMVSGGDTILAQIALNADKTVVCGAEEVTYTATASNYDKLLWFANGQLLDENSTTLTRVPRITGFNGAVDSVCAWALRSKVAGCVSADTAKAQPVLVWRVEKPVLSLACGDTTVDEGHPVLLRASATVFDGAAADVIWYDANGDEAVSGSGEASYQVTHKTKGEYLHYVQAIQSDLEEDLPECYSYDSVRITVEEGVGIENPHEVLALIAPNPTSGRFTIKTSVSCRIEIFSLSGTCVWFRENALGRIPVSLNVSGVYFVRVMDPASGRFSIQKLVVR